MLTLKLTLKYLFLFAGLLLLCPMAAQYRNIGLPFIQSFPKEDYHAAPQNWSVAQDQRGVVFFANNKGVLSFDGSQWKTYPLPNRSIVRSVAVAKNGYIFAGGQNEFGYYKPNAQGDWAFVSLRNAIPEVHRSFEDVWTILMDEDAVYFRASEKIFRWKAREMEIFDQRNFLFMGTANRQIYAQDEDGKLFVFKNSQLQAVEEGNIFKNKLLTGIVSLDSSLLFATLENGLYELKNGEFSAFQTDSDDFLKQNQIACLQKLSGDRLAIGTNFNGILIVKSDGHFIYHFSKQTGLLNNKVLSLHQDKSNNLWVGLLNGINHVEINSPFTHILPDGTLEGSGYDVEVYQNQIYFCTSNGLYVAPWKNHYSPLTRTEFELIDNSKGEAWGLDVVDDNLYMAHNKGAFQVENRRAQLLNDEIGFWNFQTLLTDTNYVLTGTYSDLFLFEKQDKTWQQLTDFKESCRFVEQDGEGNIWIAHPYKGIFRARPNSEKGTIQLDKYGVAQGLPSDLLNHVFKIKNKIIVCGEQGVYEFDASQKRFVPAVDFNKMFGTQTKIRRLYETPNGNIWYITTDELGVIEISQRGLELDVRKKAFPNLSQNLNQGFEKIYAFDDNNVFFTYDKGFLHYHSENIDLETAPLKVVFTNVRTTNNQDSVIFTGVYELNEQVVAAPVEATRLHPKNNAIAFDFSATEYNASANGQYRYFLEGADEDWSAWKSATSKAYTNLLPGDYIFQVQALHPDGRESEVLAYPFEIEPPWYWSPVSKSIYGILTLLILTFAGRAFFKEYQHLQAETEQVVQQSQLEIGKLKEEKTQAELQHKQRELVSMTMHLVQKNERLDEIKNRLITIEKKSAEKAVSKELNSLVRQLEQDEVLDEGWEQFMLHFNQLHGNYFDRLKNQYPNLTPKDLKLCAYLRMNLSTKEIATLMNITVRGVEASRYRLRKKIALDKEKNLTSFLMHY